MVGVPTVSSTVSIEAFISFTLEGFSNGRLELIRTPFIMDVFYKKILLRLLDFFRQVLLRDFRRIEV